MSLTEFHKHISGTREKLGELSLQRDLLKYLDFEGYLQELATSGLKYLEAVTDVRSKGMIGPPLYFRPELNLLNLKRISVDLVTLLQTEPECAEKLIQQLSFQIFFECLGAERLQGGLELEHIQTPLRVVCQSAYSLLVDAEVGAGLVILKGVLTAYTFPTKYVRTCVVHCKINTCPGHAPRRQRGIFIPGTFCKFCRCEEIEMVGDRDVGEEVLATFLPLDGLSIGRQGKTKTKMVIFRDELAAGLSIGCNVQVVCRRAMVSRMATGPTLVACSRLIPVAASLPVQLGYFPEKIQDFFGQFGNSPWAPTASMALSLGRTAVPYECLFNIRMGAILSISSHGAHQPLHMLVTGRENVLASRLLDLAAQVAPRSLSHGCQNALSGVAKKSEDARQDLWIEAGSLLLGTSGVCAVGEWTSLKKETKTDLASAIEKGSITIKLPNKPIHFPLRASVWTHCARLDKKSMRPMIEVFGMPFIADVTEKENQHLVHYFLNKAIASKNVETEAEILCLSDIKGFLSSVEATTVKMSDAASKLIRNYFVASRRARAIGGSVDECLPIGAVQSMSIMAEAHARLSLRAEATPNDALVAIALYEHALVSLFGPAFQAPPLPLSGVDLCKGNLQQSVDKYMQATEQWLRSFISTLLGNQC